MKEETRVDFDQELIEMLLSNNLQGVVTALAKEFKSQAFGEDTNIHSSAIIQTYIRLRNLVEQGLREAKQNGKKLLLLIGEFHTDKKSLLIEAMLFHILTELKINTVCYENDPEVIKVINSNLNIIWYSKIMPRLYTSLWQEEVKDAKYYNVIYTLRLASELKLTSIGVDLSQDITKSSGSRANNYFLIERNDHIENGMLKLKKDCILIVGSGHIKNLLERQRLHDEFHIVTMNTTDIVIRKSFHTNMNDSTLIEAIEWSYSEKNVNQANLPDNIRQVSAEMLISLAKQVHDCDSKNKVLNTEKNQEVGNANCIIS